MNEIATNALIHGGPPASLRIWNEGGEILFEVMDGGTGIADVFAGQLRPEPDVLGGRGLWLTRIMADAVEIRSDAGGSAVTIHAALPGSAFA